MPLTYDSEFQRELEANRDRALASSNRRWWGYLIISSGLFAAVLWFLRYINAADSTTVAVMIAVASLCVICAINSALRVMHASLVLNMGVIEWVGRKQLGEYEED